MNALMPDIGEHTTMQVLLLVLVLSHEGGEANIAHDLLTAVQVQTFPGWLALGEACFTLALLVGEIAKRREWPGHDAVSEKVGAPISKPRENRINMYEVLHAQDSEIKGAGGEYSSGQCPDFFLHCSCRVPVVIDIVKDDKSRAILVNFYSARCRIKPERIHGEAGRGPQPVTPPAERAAVFPDLARGQHRIAQSNRARL